MKNKKTPYQLFQEKAITYNDALVKDYTERINKTREGHQNKVYYKFLEQIRKQHQAIQVELGEHKHFCREIDDELIEDKDKEFDTTFNERFDVINDVDKNILLENLAKLKAFNNLFDFLAIEGIQYWEKSNPKPHETKTSIHWTGKTELEFVQLIYALHEAKYLHNDEDEITTLVKQVAAVFNYELGKNWPSNHSESVNDRNADYESKIFAKLAKAYADYREGLLDKENKITPK